MHNGWKKICRSVCRKMDVFVQRRWLCNLITSVASVADSGIIFSYSVSITWLNFVALPAARDGDLGRGGEILAQLLTRGLPFAGCLLHQRAAGGVSPGQGVHGGRGGGGEGCRGLVQPHPGEAPEEPRPGCTMVPLSGPGSFARSHRNLGLGCMATAERRRNKTEIKIDPPPPLPWPSPDSELGVVLTSVLQAEPVPLARVCAAPSTASAVCWASLGVSSDCSQLWQGAAPLCYNTAWLAGGKCCQIQQLHTPVTFTGTQKVVSLRVSGVLEVSGWRAKV